MSIRGAAAVGYGEGEGGDKAVSAMRHAISSPLIDQARISGAKGVLVSLSCGDDLMLSELNEAIRLLKEITSPEANIFFGAVFDENLAGRVMITIIATGLESDLTPAALGHTRLQSGKIEEQSLDLFAVSEKPGPPSPFIKGEKNYYRGEDLDIPTIWRKKKKKKSAT